VGLVIHDGLLGVSAVWIPYSCNDCTPRGIRMKMAHKHTRTLVRTQLCRVALGCAKHTRVFMKGLTEPPPGHDSVIGIQGEGV